MAEEHPKTLSTPTRRLGLSRKSMPSFKSSPIIKVSPASLERAIALFKGIGSPTVADNDDPVPPVVAQLQKQVSITPQRTRAPLRPLCNNSKKFRSPLMVKIDTKKSTNILSKEDIISKTIKLEELKKKLISSQNIKELEDTVDMWKEGCKKTLLYLQSWIATNENIHVSCKDLSERLGISTVVHDHFKTDSQISTNDC